MDVSLGSHQRRAYVWRKVYIARHGDRPIGFALALPHPKKARAYTILKEELVRKYFYDIESYIRGKADFIADIDIEKPGYGKLNRTVKKQVTTCFFFNA